MDVFVFASCIHISIIYWLISTLQELHLSFNEINKTGAMVIAESVDNKDVLEKLELDGKSSMICIILVAKYYSQTCFVFSSYPPKSCLVLTVVI